MTQEEQILKHLQIIGSLTPLEALNLYGCFRLGARIWELRNQGHDIKMELVQHGKKHYAKYTLAQFSTVNGQQVFV